MSHWDGLPSAGQEQPHSRQKGQNQAISEDVLGRKPAGRTRHARDECLPFRVGQALLFQSLAH